MDILLPKKQILHPQGANYLLHSTKQYSVICLLLVLYLLPVKGQEN